MPRECRVLCRQHGQRYFFSDSQGSVIFMNRTTERPTTNDGLTKLLQEPNIPLKEILQIIDPVLQQGQPVHAHPEGKSRDFLRVVPVVLHKFEYVWIDHSATEHFNPPGLFAGTAR